MIVGKVMASTWGRLSVVSLAAILLGLSWTSGLINQGPTVCLLRLTTGVPCPMCGTTRATAALFAGDISSALALNSVGLMFVIFGTLLFLFPNFRAKFFDQISIKFRDYPKFTWLSLIAIYFSIWVSRF